MKNNLNELGDILSVLVGIIGALLKGIKNKLNVVTIILACCIAGILSYASMGIIEIFYTDLSPKIVIFISFCVGWVANELTSKLDLLVNDFYDIFIEYIKSYFKPKKRKDESNTNP